MDTLEKIAILARELEPQRGGLRPLDPAGVDGLALSMRGLGFDPGHRIVRDQYGRILDGRHRIAAAERVGIEWDPGCVRTVRVVSDREALALAYHINAGMLTTEHRRHRDRLAKRLTGQTIEALLAEAERPDDEGPAVTPAVTQPEPCPHCGAPMRVCEQCGHPMPPGTRPEARTCSTRCRVALHRALQRAKETRWG